MSVLKRTKKSFKTWESAVSASKSLKGEIEIKELANGLFKVIYNRELNKPNPIKYKTISFSSKGSASSFCNKLKQKGLANNTNQDVVVNTISPTLYKVRFTINKQYQASNKYAEEWNESNLDETFAYNGSSEDF